MSACPLSIASSKAASWLLFLRFTSAPALRSLFTQSKCPSCKGQFKHQLLATAESFTIVSHVPLCTADANANTDGQWERSLIAFLRNFSTYTQVSKLDVRRMLVKNLNKIQIFIKRKKEWRSVHMLKCYTHFFYETEHYDKL